MAWFGRKKKEDEEDTSPDTPENSAGEESQRVTISDAALEKLKQLIQDAANPVLGIRILAEATSPMNPEYSLAFVQEGEDFDDDTIIEYEDFKVFIDADSQEFVDSVKLDFVQSGMGGGFRIDKVVAPAAVAEGPVADRLRQVIDQQINPALQLHGGFVNLVDVKDSTAYIELGGGCRGCGMVDVTLKQGIEVMIKQSVPEISEILDTTDHASGRNPYYKPGK